MAWFIPPFFQKRHHLWKGTDALPSLKGSFVQSVMSKKSHNLAVLFYIPRGNKSHLYTIDSAGYSLELWRYP